jgi:hypothetical protein
MGPPAVPQTFFVAPIGETERSRGCCRPANFKNTRVEGKGRSADLITVIPFLVHRSTADLLLILARSEILIFLCFKPRGSPTPSGFCLAFSSKHSIKVWLRSGFLRSRLPLGFPKRNQAKVGENSL